MIYGLIYRARSPTPTASRDPFLLCSVPLSCIISHPPHQTLHRGTEAAQMQNAVKPSCPGSGHTNINDCEVVFQVNSMCGSLLLFFPKLLFFFLFCPVWLNLRGEIAVVEDVDLVR